MSGRRFRKRGRPVTSDRVWIQPVMNDELDVTKLSRAFLALALHRAAEEAEAQAEHVSEPRDGDTHELS